MSNFNMSQLNLDKNGNYRDVNGNIVAQKGQALNGAAWRYLANKYGRDYANNTSAQTRSGNTYQNGRWQPTQKNNQQNKDQQESDISWGGKLFKEVGKGIAALTGTKYKLKDSKADLFGTAAYFLPGLGNALSAGDAIDAARKGDWMDAAMNTAFAIPFIGNVGRYIKSGLQAAKFAKTANLVGKGVKGLEKVKKPANYLQNAKLSYDTPEIVIGMHDSYQGVKQGKQQWQPLLERIQKAKQNGMSEQQLKNVLGDKYDYINKLSSRSNSFLGNLGTMWDFMEEN